MNSVVLRCPNCGGKIVLNESKDKGYCENCGSEIIYQKEIDKLHEQNKSGIENALFRINDLLSNRKYISAEKIIDEYLIEYPFAGELYLSKLMCVLNVKKVEDLANVERDFSNHPLYIRALKYLPSSKKDDLLALVNGKSEVEGSGSSAGSGVELPRMKKIDKEVMDSCMTDFLKTYHKDVCEIIKSDSNLYQKLLMLNTIVNKDNPSQKIDLINLVLNKCRNIRFIEQDDKSLVNFLFDDMATRFTVMDKYLSLSEPDDFSLKPEFKHTVELMLERVKALSEVYEFESTVDDENEELDADIEKLNYELGGLGLFNHSKKVSISKEINNKKKKQLENKLTLACKKLDFIKMANAEELNALNDELSHCAMTAFGRKKELKDKISVITSSISIDEEYLNIKELQKEINKY